MVLALDILTRAPPIAPSSDMNTTIVIPCYNEASRLNVAAFREFAQHEPEVRFLFVDDGSTDHTAQLLRELADEQPESFEAMSLPRNMGKAEAVRHGFLRAFESDAAYVGFWDADLATPLQDITTFRRLLDQRPELEMVFGARVNLLGRSIQRNLMRHWIGRIFATFAVAVIRTPIYDTQCGAKLFRVSDRTRPLFRDPFISKWIFDVELIARLVRTTRDSNGKLPGLREIIYEHPLFFWHDVAGSKLRYRDFFIVGADLLRIYVRYIKR